VGFSDGESNFSIVSKYDQSGASSKINKFSFRFTIGLHIDDKNVLVTMRNLLGVGNINENSEECKFIVSDKEGIRKLISIFDKYKLNTTKYLDYVDFKEAFNLYHSRNGVLTEELRDKLIKLKSGMNSNRINFNMPSNHIKITTYWLLGLIEGEGSFHLWRSDLIPVFSIVLTERQLPVFVKIKEFLINNLGFDNDSIWKLNNTSAMGINTQKARNSSKGSVLFIIKDIRILHNHLIPFFDKLRQDFLSKKAQDFEDFKIICRAVYYGTHKKEPIKSLILKLSHSMNNFRLSNYLGKIPAEVLTKDERNILVNAPPLIEHLWDGRLRDIESKRIIYQHESCVYKIVKPSGEVLTVQTLSESANTVGVNVKTLSKHLDVDSAVNSEFTAMVKDHKIKRIRVYYK
jgi:LAGLIDADG endonuclease